MGTDAHDGGGCLPIGSGVNEGRGVSDGYSVTASAASATGVGIAALKAPCDTTARSLRDVGFAAGGTITIAAEARGFLAAWADATAALAAGLGYLGSGVQRAATAYRATDDQAAVAFTRTSRKIPNL